MEPARTLPGEGRRLRVLAVYGTRPEAIKMAPVIRALRRRPERFEVAVCATGQHREMLDQVQELFDLRPEHDLALMACDQGLNELASRALLALDRVLRELRPDWLLVQGDTTTAASAALAAFHLRLRLGHVEAGLRTGDLERPFPEEANRRIVDLLAGALFAPTAGAARQLREGGADPARIFLTGNTVIDALHWVCEGLPAEPPRPGGGEEDEVLITVHRRESFGQPLRGIFSALRRLALDFPTVRWIYPVHPNPNVQRPAAELLAGLPNLTLCPPLSYRELVRRMRRARLILTDSGGIQEEAPTFGKPVLVLRDTTERPEGLATGVARLAGTDPARIHAEAARLLTDPAAYREMAVAANPYGDGRAAERIVKILAGESYEPFVPGAPKPER
jgi:UDP-N-acetylglucosamine 2-epimerase (non-hydrolysing)